MTIGRLTFSLVVLVVLSFVGLHLWGLLSSPSLEILSPPEGLISSGGVVEVTGKTEPGASIQINETPLPATTQTGEFKRLLVLSPGINTIIISAKKRYSKTATIERKVLVFDKSTITKSKGVPVLYE